MSGKGLSYGLNITKKPLGGRSTPAARKPIFGEDGESGSEDDEVKDSVGVEEIAEFGGLPGKGSSNGTSGIPKRPSKFQSGIQPKLGAGGSKMPVVGAYGDLAASFSSKKHAQTAEEIDASIYDYDAVYDSLKPQKKATIEDKERKPKYMGNLLAAAAVRKRDATIAEEKKLAREREAEGEEFADKEKFVTSAYKNQQEENKRLAEEERLREEQEQKNNKNAGMTNFYKNLLEKTEQKHAEVVKAAEESIKAGPVAPVKEEHIKSDADLAREINAKQEGAIAVNDEGQVVDKRQLLKGGLNIVPKPKATAPPASTRTATSGVGSNRPGFVGAGGGKQAMRERQTRMMEAQLEQATKRAFEAEEEESLKVERAAKSRKTEGDIMSAKERYLARKREAEEAKKKAE